MRAGTGYLPVTLAVANTPPVTTMGFMAAVAVVVAVLAAVTLQSAMLAIAGPHITSLRVRGGVNLDPRSPGLRPDFARDVHW